jgi:hypothetical protein
MLGAHEELDENMQCHEKTSMQNPHHSTAYLQNAQNEQGV